MLCYSPCYFLNINSKYRYILNTISLMHLIMFFIVS
nr:MAG TPA: hypothetical protein [Caudoviricetes sp.]DAX00510.1 MAG TPA: hypothetical protein [Bacteriophage sp.]